MTDDEKLLECMKLVVKLFPNHAMVLVVAEFAPDDDDASAMCYISNVDRELVQEMFDAVPEEGFNDLPIERMN